MVLERQIGRSSVGSVGRLGTLRGEPSPVPTRKAPAARRAARSRRQPRTSCGGPRAPVALRGFGRAFPCRSTGAPRPSHCKERNDCYGTGRWRSPCAAAQPTPVGSALAEARRGEGPHERRIRINTRVPPPRRARGITRRRHADKHLLPIDRGKRRPSGVAKTGHRRIRAEVERLGGLCVHRRRPRALLATAVPAAGVHAKTNNSARSLRRVTPQVAWSATQ